VSEVRQRWRLVFARDDDARFLSHLDAVRLWERAFRRGGIPVATTEGFSPRPKLVFAAPLQLGMLAEHELADLFLADRLTARDLSDRLAAGMPRGYRVVDLHDVWVGARALAPQLVAADYRMTLLNVERADLERAAVTLMAADRLPRQRRREAKSTSYDLRPLLLDLRVDPADPVAVPPDAAAAPASGLWMRLRHSQDDGAGRAEEVVAALADELDLTTEVGPAEGGEVPVPNTAEASDAVLAATRFSHLPTHPPASGTAASSAWSPATGPLEDRPALGRAAVEVIRPVRERLWLADELSV
jgi:radical SAM-linked protein